MSEIEPKKLKVTELREELKSRGLDAKGNKAQLVKRLEKALAAEAGNDAAEVDTSLVTSDLDTSHETDTSTLEQPKVDAPAPDPVHLEDDEPVIVPAVVREPEPEPEPEPYVIEQNEPEPEVEAQPGPEPQPAEAEEPEHVQQAQEALPVQEEAAEMPEAEQQPIEQHQELTPEAVEEPTPQQEAVQEPSHQPESVQEPVAQPEPETTEAEMQQTYQPSHYTEHATAEDDYTEDTATSNDYKEPAAPGTEDMEAEDEQQGEFQVMDSIGGDSEAPEADQDQRDRRGRKRRFEDDDRDHGRERRRSRRSRSRSRSPAKRRSRSRSGDRDDSRRNRSRSPPYYRRDRQPEPMENEDWLQETNLQLDRFNADLNLRIGEGGCKCNPITVEGFAFMWAGARSNYGVNKGKVAFEVKILEHLNVDHLPPEETSRHVVRAGFSTDATSLQLGEEKFSYGFGGTGKASTDCKFTDFGETFGEGDVIACYLDMEVEPHTISYSKNGNDLGTCFEIEKESLEGAALFPHVLSKNSELEINFGQKEEPFFPIKEGFTFVNDVPVEERVRGTLPAKKKKVPTATLR